MENKLNRDRNRKKSWEYVNYGQDSRNKDKWRDLGDINDPQTIGFDDRLATAIG